jgi:hypothetical protein
VTNGGEGQDVEQDRDPELSEHKRPASFRGPTSEAGIGSETRRRRSQFGIERGPKKRNPAVGAPGYIFVVIGVYGFNYAAWLRAVSPYCFCLAGSSLYVFFVAAVNVFFLFCFLFFLLNSNLPEACQFSQQFLSVTHSIALHQGRA